MGGYLDQPMIEDLNMDKQIKSQARKIVANLEKLPPRDTSAAQRNADARLFALLAK